uniref:Uncharacterized protein n=1 Tax=Terrapene triunguis TaxID=2587831 RepID=A0A674JZC9_9SAUR
MSEVLPYGEDKLGHCGEVGQISFTCRPPAGHQQLHRGVGGAEQEAPPSWGRSAGAREIFKSRLDKCLSGMV